MGKLFFYWEKLYLWLGSEFLLHVQIKCNKPGVFGNPRAPWKLRVFLSRVTVEGETVGAVSWVPLSWEHTGLWSWSFAKIYVRGALQNAEDRIVCSIPLSFILIIFGIYYCVTWSSFLKQSKAFLPTLQFCFPFLEWSQSCISILKKVRLGLL